MDFNVTSNPIIYSIAGNECPGHLRCLAHHSFLTIVSFTVLESPVRMSGALGTMDQRMAAHAFYTQLFPALDESELRLFAECQDRVVLNGRGKHATIWPADGRSPHFTGNIHEVIGNPNVAYGVENWPDPSCSFVMQIDKLSKWTGDKQFAAYMYPHVKRAMAWLATANTAGDLIPKGGSTYDYERAPNASFIYTASCYLGALRAAADIEREQGDLDLFTAVQANVMKEFWNGTYFIKTYDPKTGKKNPNSFVASLAGDWLSRLCASSRTLAPTISHAEVDQLIARHVRPFFPVMPMEVTPHGKQAVDAGYILEDEPYLGCEAIYENRVDAGLQVIRRDYDIFWLQGRDPWHAGLKVHSPSGVRYDLPSYMTNATTWHVINALTGITIDIGAQRLYVSPRVGEMLPELHMPVYLYLSKVIAG